MKRSGLCHLIFVTIVSVAAAVQAFAQNDGDDIEVGGLSFTVQTANRPWSIQNPHPGTLRFELRAGDVWYQDAPIKERTEIAGETVYAAGEDITVSYDFRVAPGAENTSDWLLLGQLHATDSVTNPIFAVELIGEHLAIHLRYKLPDGQFEDWFAFTDDKPIVRGKYYHVEARLQMRDGDRGRVDVWLDGEHVVDYAGRIGYGYGVYWKQGIYRAASPEEMTVDYRELSIERETGVGD